MAVQNLSDVREVGGQNCTAKRELCIKQASLQTMRNLLGPLLFELQTKKRKQKRKRKSLWNNVLYWCPYYFFVPFLWLLELNFVQVKKYIATGLRHF